MVLPVITCLTLGWLHNSVSTITRSTPLTVLQLASQTCSRCTIRTALGDGVAIVALLKGRLSERHRRSAGLPGDVSEHAALQTVQLGPPGAGLGGAGPRHRPQVSPFAYPPRHHRYQRSQVCSRCCMAGFARIAWRTGLAVLRPIIALLAFDLIDPPIAAKARLACNLLTATRCRRCSLCRRKGTGLGLTRHRRTARRWRHRCAHRHNNSYADHGSYT